MIKKTSMFFLLYMLLFIFATFAYSSENKNGPVMTLKNTNNQLMVYLLFWVDHPYPQYVEPLNIAGGELKVDERNTLTYKYKPGHFFVIWYDKDGKLFNSFEFRTTKNIKEITITDNGLKRVRK